MLIIFKFKLPKHHSARKILSCIFPQIPQVATMTKIAMNARKLDYDKNQKHNAFPKTIMLLSMIISQDLCIPAVKTQ